MVVEGCTEETYVTPYLGHMAQTCHRIPCLNDAFGVVWILKGDLVLNAGHVCSLLTKATTQSWGLHSTEVLTHQPRV